jgi:hypothetical protein
MNRMLLRAGYPRLAVGPADRNVYLDALERRSLTEELRPIKTFTPMRLDATLDNYPSGLREALP